MPAVDSEGEEAAIQPKVATLILRCRVLALIKIPGYDHAQVAVQEGEELLDLRRLSFLDLHWDFFVRRDRFAHHGVLEVDLLR